MDSDDDEPPILIDMTMQQAPPLTNEEETNGSDPMNVNLAPCPVTILSGFLGSGKTTLIQYILKSPDHGKRIAVIENEFGEGLDVETLIARDGVDPDSNNLQDFIELPNGCICCTVKDSLVATLENLVEQRNDLDYILIEASGMANPGPIASVFWLDDALESRLQLDGIVTLVDAHNILQQLASTEEAAQQIAYSDRLLINKTDLLKSPEHLKTVEQALRKLHPTAPMQLTTYSKVPNLEWILNANCFGGASRLEELNQIWEEAATTTTSDTTSQGGHDHSHGHGHAHSDKHAPSHKENHAHTGSHDHAHHHHEHGDEDCAACAHAAQEEQRHRHTEAVTTVALQHTGSVSLQKLNAWLAEILWPNQDETNQVLTAALQNPQQREAFLHHKQQTAKTVPQIFRVKGIVSVQLPADALLLMDDYEIQTYMEPATKPTLEEHNANDSRWRRDRRRYIVQGVHDLWDVHPASGDLQFGAEEERGAKLVVIGRHLPRKLLQEGFAACFV